MDIEKELEGLSDSINEMLTSTAAVKGQAFADAVAISFESVQLMESISRLAGLANKGHEEFAKALHDSALNMTSSIVAKACDGIDDKDLEEVMKMSSALYQRRRLAVQAIRKGMGDAKS